LGVQNLNPTSGSFYAYKTSNQNFNSNTDLALIAGLKSIIRSGLVLLSNVTELGLFEKA